MVASLLSVVASRLFRNEPRVARAVKITTSAGKAVSAFGPSRLSDVIRNSLLRPGQVYPRSRFELTGVKCAIYTLPMVARVN
jgi:hypothetical protein